jgi:hypothetical protein
VRTVTHNLVTDITEALITSLGETAAWQTNLDDDEKHICLTWAARQFDSAIRQARTHALAQLRTVNDLVGRPEITRSDVIKAVLGE